jgi:hypothetical protein
MPADNRSTEELIDALLDAVPDGAIQIHRERLAGATEYTIGWETPTWPYTGMRRNPDLRRALTDSIDHAERQKTPEYRAQASRFGKERQKFPG